MAALAYTFPDGNLHVTDLPYRLSSWGLDDPGNVRLWLDPAGQLLGWAVLQTPWWAIDYAMHPKAGEDLHRQILAWAEERAWKTLDTPGGHPAWFVNVFAGQSDRIRELESAGWASQADIGEDSWSKVLLRRPGQTPIARHRLPAGFVLRPLAGEGEVEAYVDLHQTVFESKNMTAAWRGRTLQHPDYTPDLDLVAEAPDGSQAAFCIGWLNRRSAGGPTGQIEPLGCHPDFRRYGLGRLLLLEGLRRLQACGVQSVVVETDNYRNTAFELYQSVGFEVVQNVLVYRKDFPAPRG
jgi:mycothiol synthase